MVRVLAIQGPKTNLPGGPEHDLYGSVNPEEVHGRLQVKGGDPGIQAKTAPSRPEGNLGGDTQCAKVEGCLSIIINNSPR